MRAGVSYSGSVHKMSLACNLGQGRYYLMRTASQGSVVKLRSARLTIHSFTWIKMAFVLEPLRTGIGVERSKVRFLESDSFTICFLLEINKRGWRIHMISDWKSCFPVG